ncbi:MULTISPECIES: AAA family ATPase [Ramlibacter]|uniref:AAA family ATPase n=1 Tax=Ramlibacter aquaticus TaxID=2780094 RepID=A0ABR9SAY5_9BURK|nr:MULTISPECIES: AAA family ATPase [Ramlibacter]MBE7939520.1 AAA family ATPase [Ramlibacter aquaticus]
MLPNALSNRYDELEGLRHEHRLVVARGRLRGKPVMLWHRFGLGHEAAAANRTTAERLKAAGGTHAPLEWHEGPSGITWALAHEDGEFLDDWLEKSGPVDLAVALRLLRDLAESLDALHRSRIAHLRLRPTTVHVRAGERLRAALFNAEAVPFEVAAATRHGGEGDDPRHTAPELTGRTASQPDARTDLYLLGLLAYRLLAGRLPFEASDPLGWLHAHLALQPEDLRAQRRDMPAAVAELVAAMLAKSPLQRPASARAVAEELAHCIAALEQRQPSQVPAPVASRARFALPRLVVGRERERAQLDQALARVQSGRVELVVLQGPSGIGKSSLALEFLQRARGQGVLTALAKCEQHGSQRPYPALAGLLDNLALQPDLARVPIGSEAAALGVLSTALARRLGIASHPIELPPEQARQRLLSALVSLLRELTREQVLVLFIDDVQWSEAATLAMVAAAVAERDLRRVLVVAGLRTDAQAPADLLAAFAELPHTTLDLAALEDADIRRWMEAALPAGLAHPEPMLAWLTQRSGGNPLFLGQLLATLVAQGQLMPRDSGRWVLETRGGATPALPASALEAVSSRLRTLPAEQAALLGLAAAAGRQFSAQLLASATGRPLAALTPALERAQAEGLVEPEGEHTWRFVHDRLQQAAYESADAATRLDWHLRLGQALRVQDTDAALFDSCRHLEQALSLLDPGARREFALAAQRAAGKAHASAAFAQQARLLRTALTALASALPLSPAQRLALMHEATDAFVLTQDFEAAEACLAEARRLEADPLARARGDELRIRMLVAQQRAQEALQAGVEALGRLGLRVSTERATLDTVLQLVRLRLRLRGRPVAAWIDAPAATDPAQLQLQRLIFATISVAHTLASPLYAVLGLAGTRLAFERGVTPWSWQPISVAGHVLSGVFDDIDTGHALGELSVRLGERFGTHSLSFNHLFYVMHWKVPIASTLPLLRNCFEQAERSGNPEIAGYAAGMFVGVTWNAMGSLSALDDALHEVRPLGERHRNALVLDCCASFDWLLGLLRGGAPRAPIEPLRRLRSEGDALPHDEIFELVHDQLAVMLNVMAGFYGDDVVAHGERVRRNLHRMAGNFSTPLHHWFEALLHAQRLRERPVGASRRLVHKHLRKLRAWAAHCPENHLHRVASLEAELAALAGDPAASRQYGRAVELARAQGFTGDAAIVAHRWARHCARTGDPAGLRDALELAHGLYSQWGATCMVRQIEEDMPGFARPRSGAHAVPLDTLTLVKASQSISAELEMAAVAARLLQQAMENAGARYAALLLHLDGQLVLAAQRAEAGARQEPPTPVPLAQTLLPAPLLRAVQQGGEALVLEDACAPHPWGASPRWHGRAGVSVLCVPVVAARDVLGVLYLENELTAGCFTPERTTLAGVLAGQAAIAIANARLFSELGAAHAGLRQANTRLEERVAERTRALEENHARLRRLERQIAADEERQRIMRDLHDGLGSQLFVTLSRVERDELEREDIASALRACIADMRLVLEAMTPDGNDFLAAWGSFRFRWEAQLAQAGLASHWAVRGAGDTLELPAATALQVLRIAQEGLANVMKHARAKRVEVGIAVEDGALCLAVRDDGVGLKDAPGPGSRGLDNMRARARRLGATLAIEAAHPGTRLALQLPLPPRHA